MHTELYTGDQHSLLEIFLVNKRKSSGSKVAGTFTHGSVKITENFAHSVILFPLFYGTVRKIDGNHSIIPYFCYL